MELADRLLTRFKAMQSARAPYESTRQELAELYLPHKAAQGTKTPGSEGTERIWDSTPAHALIMMAARMYGMETNPASQWLGVGYRDLRNGIKDTDEFKKWAADAVKAILDTLSNEETNFYTASHQCTTDKVLFGMYAKYIEEDEENLLRVKALPIHEIYVAEAANGVIDTVYRKYTMTARQVVQTWGSKAVSQKVRDCMEQEKPEEPVEILHCVYPREDIRPGKKGNKNYPIASVYMEVGEKHILEEGGYHEMPISCPRWETGAGEVYGRGPALTALADTRVLYAQIRSAMLVAEKMGQPTLLLSDDDMLNGKPDNGPGGVLYYRAGSDDKPAYLTTPGDLNAIGKMVERTDANVRQIFMSNQFDDTDRPNMTATEAQLKHADRWQLLGAVLGRSQAEGLTIEVNRMLAILMRRGVIDPLPEGYSVRNLRFFYTNPLTLSQKQGQAQGMRVLLELVAPLLGKDDPYGVMDNYDTDVYARQAHEISGADPDMLRGKQKVAALRGQKNQQRQAQAALGTAEQVAGIAATASQADMSKPNGLTALTGAMG